MRTDLIMTLGISRVLCIELRKFPGRAFVEVINFALWWQLIFVQLQTFDDYLIFIRVKDVIPFINSRKIKSLLTSLVESSESKKDPPLSIHRRVQCLPSVRPTRKKKSSRWQSELSNYERQLSEPSAKITALSIVSRRRIKDAFVALFFPCSRSSYPNNAEKCRLMHALRLIRWRLVSNAAVRMRQVG